MSSTVTSFGMLIVLEIAPERNGCTAAIMRMWPDVMDEALAVLAAAVGAVEDRQVLRLEMRRALDGLHAADHVVGLVDLLLAEADRPEQVEVGLLPLLLRRCPGAPWLPRPASRR